MISYVYSHRRELQSQVHALKLIGKFSGREHIALRLVNSPHKLEHGRFELEESAFIDWRIFLTFRTDLDSTSHSSVRRLMRMISHKHPNVETMVVGDLAGPKAVVAQAWQEAGKHLTFFPEGIGIFRAEFGGYLWQSLSWKEGLFSRIKSSQELLRQPSKSQLSRAKLGFRLLGHLGRVVVNGIAENHRPLTTTLKIADEAINPWGPEVPLPLKAREQIFTFPEQHTSGTRPRLESGTALFLQTPEEVSPKVWIEVLAPIRRKASRVIIKWHRVNKGREGLLLALESLGFAIEECPDASAPLESLRLPTVPEYFVGTYTSALLDVAFQYPYSTVLCVAKSLEKATAGPENDASQYVGSHQLKALEKYLSGRVRFL